MALVTGVVSASAQSAAPGAMGAGPGAAAFDRTALNGAALEGGTAEALPDAPEPQALAAGSPASMSGVGPGSRRRVFSIAPLDDKYIKPGQVTQRLTPEEKLRIAQKYAVSPFSVAGWFVSAGYSQLRNSPPNYGTDRGAFGERLGTAALGHVSEDFLGDALASSVLREDPRYYVLGPGHGILHRTIYAMTRTLVTRTDDGRVAPNLALLSGNLATAGLTNAYFPQVNRGGIRTMKTFGASLGGSALGFVAAEFYGDFSQVLHRRGK